MPRRTPQQAADRWARSMAASTQNYTDGINSVQTHPGELAARNVQGYQNGVAQAVASGKWQQNVQRGSLQDWKNAAANKGAQRLASGAAAAVNKVAQANERVFPMIDQATASIANMPRTDAASRIARATAYMTRMHELASGGRR